MSQTNLQRSIPVAFAALAFSFSGCKPQSSTSPSGQTSLTIPVSEKAALYVRALDENLLCVTQVAGELQFYKTSSGYAQSGASVQMPGLSFGGQSSAGNIYTKISPLEALAYVNNDWRQIRDSADRELKLNPNSVNPVLIQDSLEPLVDPLVQSSRVLAVSLSDTSSSAPFVAKDRLDEVLHSQQLQDSWSLSQGSYLSMPIFPHAKLSPNITLMELPPRPKMTYSESVASGRPVPIGDPEFREELKAMADYESIKSAREIALRSLNVVEEDSLPVYILLANKDLLRISQTGGKISFHKNAAGYSSSRVQGSIAGFGGSIETAEGNLYYEIQPGEVVGYENGKRDRILDAVCKQALVFPKRAVSETLVAEALGVKKQPNIGLLDFPSKN